MTACLMRFYCPHGVGVGHHIAKDAESVDDVASGIMCTFRKAPKHLVYDYACQLANYCRIREPRYWQHTVFVGDELHSKGHKCSEAHNGGLYKTGGGVGVHGVNDTVVEQANANLNTVKASASYSAIDLLMRQATIAVEVERRFAYQKFKEFDPERDLKL